MHLTKDAKILHLNTNDAELVAARKAWRSDEFIDDDQRWRPMVERAIFWRLGTRHRRVRYRGIERNQAGLRIRVAAINLRRIVNLGPDQPNGTWIIAVRSSTRVQNSEDRPRRWNNLVVHQRYH